MKNSLLLILILSMLAACSPSADITGSWKNPDFHRASINKILVTALTSDEESRQTLENDLAMALQQKDYKAVKSMEIVGMPILSQQAGTSSEEGRDTLLTKIKESEIDAILTVALINDQPENRFVPGRYNYEPIQQFEYYRGFWDYYSNRHTTVNTPGYYEENQVYFLEINLYDTETEELLWSAQSETYSPGKLSSVSRDFTAVVIDKMEDDGIIR